MALDPGSCIPRIPAHGLGWGVRLVRPWIQGHGYDCRQQGAMYLACVSSKRFRGPALQWMAVARAGTTL